MSRDTSPALIRMLQLPPGLLIVSFLLTSSPAASGQFYLRLAGGGCSGRVEIFHQRAWATVCGGSLALNDAQVVCRQLDCGTALSTTQSVQFGDSWGHRLIWLDVTCLGYEHDIKYCQSRGFGERICPHRKEEEIICSGSVKPSISVNATAVSTWEQHVVVNLGQDVVVTCSISTPYQGAMFDLQRLSGSVSPHRQTSSSSSATFIILSVDFKDEGLYQCYYRSRFQPMRYSTNYMRTSTSDYVRVSVTVPLQQPNISLTTPDGAGVLWSAEAAVVTRGHSFVITCSIATLYPGGVFSLIFSGPNITDTKPAVHHSASFEFPVAGDQHQGNYSCVYKVTLSSRTFTSASATSISVIIKSPLLLLLSLVAAGSLVLLLSVLALICLVHRRRRQPPPPPAVARFAQFAVRNHQEDCEEEEKQHYVNFEPMQRKERQRKRARGLMDEDRNKGKERKDTDDYEVFPEIYGGQEDIYENIPQQNKSTGIK